MWYGVLQGKSARQRLHPDTGSTSLTTQEYHNIHLSYDCRRRTRNRYLEYCFAVIPAYASRVVHGFRNVYTYTHHIMQFS